MVNIQALNALDEALMNAARVVKPLYYVEPVNAEEQKREFLSDRIRNPVFSYRDLEYDPKAVEQRLNSIETPDDALRMIFEKKRRDTLLENRVVVNRGNEDAVRKATIEMYGSPDKSLVEDADRLLRQIPNADSPKTVPSERIRDALERALYNYGVVDWDVEFSDKRLTTIYPAEKKITVCRNRTFTDGDPERLKVHEVGVHALRAVNGYEQPLKIFALGLLGYLPTEEGLTLYFEELTGNTDEQMIREYAARVIAVDSVLEGLDFRKTFDRLKSCDLTDNQAWNLAVRAHRGGGYIKDHVYLDGYRRVREFAERDGDFKTLYVGKVGIEDLHLVSGLLAEGVLKEARYLPPFIK